MTNANLKIAAVFVTLTVLAVLFGSSDVLAGFTHFFNLAAVGIFAWRPPLAWPRVYAPKVSPVLSV